MPDLENPDDDDGGDSDYEAELAAITAGDEKKEKKPKPKVIPQADLDKMVADSLRDIGLLILFFAFKGSNGVDLLILNFCFPSKVPMKSCPETMMIQIC